METKYRSILHELTNFAETEKAKSIDYFNNFSFKHIEFYNDQVAIKAKNLGERCRQGTLTQRKKYSRKSIQTTQSIIDNAIEEFTTFDLNIQSSIADIIRTGGMSLIDDIVNSINAKLDSLVKTVLGFPDIIVALQNDAIRLINSITQEMTDFVSSTINSFLLQASKTSAKYINQIKSIIDLLKTPLGKIRFDLFGETQYDFYKRDKGEASISKYAQANIPDIYGKLVDNTKKALKKTPDEKILMPQLKIDVNIIKRFAGLSLPDIPSISSLKSLFSGGGGSSFPSLSQISSTAQSYLPSIDQIKAGLPAIPTVGQVKQKLMTIGSTQYLSSLSSFASMGSGAGFSAGLIPIPNFNVIDEPVPTSKDASYGKIQVKENKGGFVEISDETPGNIRKINQHPTGTYNAMLNDGSYHTKTTANKQEMTDGDWRIKTEGDKIEIVSGNAKIEIRRNFQESIQGSSDTFITGTKNQSVTGKVTNDFKSDYEEKIIGNRKSSVNGFRKYQTNGYVEDKITGYYKQQVNGIFSIKVMGTCSITSVGPATISSNSLVRISAPIVRIN